MYGYIKQEEVASKSFINFGLNQGTLKSFDLIQDYLQLVVLVGDSERNKRFYEPTKHYYQGQEIFEGHPNFEERRAEDVKIFARTICSIVEAFVPVEQIEAALSTGTNSFSEFAKKLTNLVAASPNKGQQLDIFFQYQNKLVNGVQFLELPSNTKQGLFIVKHLEGNYVENRDGNALKYINEEGHIHPISRSSWWVTSSGNGTKIEVPVATNGESSTTEEHPENINNPFNF